MHRLKVEKKVL